MGRWGFDEGWAGNGHLVGASVLMVARRRSKGRECRSGGRAARLVLVFKLNSMRLHSIADNIGVQSRQQTAEVHSGCCLGCSSARELNRCQAFSAVSPGLVIFSIAYSTVEDNIHVVVKWLHSDRVKVIASQSPRPPSRSKLSAPRDLIC